MDVLLFIVTWMSNDTNFVSQSGLTCNKSNNNNWINYITKYGNIQKFIIHTSFAVKSEPKCILVLFLIAFCINQQGRWYTLKTEWYYYQRATWMVSYFNSLSVICGLHDNQQEALYKLNITIQDSFTFPYECQQIKRGKKNWKSSSVKLLLLFICPVWVNSKHLQHSQHSQ